VLKLMRVARLPAGLVLYRGLGGLTLPPSFYRTGSDGFRGFAEWGFLSTTSNKDIAIEV
jgi:hypothetical protein